MAARILVRRWVACLLLAASSLLAHHSTAPYDLIHGTIIVGKVRTFSWQNPHGQIMLDVAGEDHAVEHWAIEIESPGVLMRLGWTKDTLKNGDTITVTGSRAKNGGFYLKALSVQLPDGRNLPAIARAGN
jgi:Family of unknown function (DUF6152)